MQQIHKQNIELFYPDLSYKINGVLFDVYKELGPGYREKHIQRAVANALERNGLSYKEQLMFAMESNGKCIGRYFMDFVVDDKIVLELKVGERLYQKDYDQVKHYLFRSGLGLGLLARFGRNGVRVERVLQPQQLS